jgi:hypothetical protein
MNHSEVVACSSFGTDNFKMSHKELECDEHNGLRK